MTFDLASDWIVLPWLAAALVVLGLVWRRSGPAMARSRHWVLWLLRCGILAALLAIGLNPVLVALTPGSIHRPEVHVLLDASQSMLLGSPKTRWQEGTELLRTALEREQERADVHVHRFGQRLVAVDLPSFLAGQDLPRPEDADTQLAAALQQLAGRLSREGPASVIVISDGRVRDAEKVDEMASLWRRLRVPVHVVPLGGAAQGGDAAIIAAVAPAKARKQAQVEVDVFLRSFGFVGRRTELQLQALDETGKVRKTLTSLPVTLQDGMQPVSLSFRTEPDIKRLRLHLQPLPHDLSPANNDFPLEIEIDRTKIRVLVLEGSSESGFFRFARNLGGEPGEDSGAPYAPFRDALLSDPDIQCTVFNVSGGQPVRVPTRETAYLPGAFHQTAAELLAYDALVLSNVPRSALSDEVLGWVEEWIGKRGGGLLMAGGPQSFGAGGWSGTAIERMLPVEFPGSNDWDSTPTILEPSGADLHPVWRLFEDERATRAALKTLPESLGRNNWARVKPQSGMLLGTQKAGTGTGTPPLLAIGPYGRGRTAALATPLSASWSPRFTRQWGEQDNQYFARFARNLTYWLTESSAIGRRRLVATTDKRFYRPGESVAIAAHTFDESANRTGRYRVVAMLEPRQLDSAELPPCPVKWPVGRPRTSGESGSLAGWGEEIELNLDPQSKDHSLALPLVEALANGSGGQAFKLELTAYEGQTQIDSGSLDVQILSDPHEQQNPLPNREFLAALARGTGGREISDAKALADVLSDLPITEGPATVRHTPLWSTGWILGVLLSLLAAEWFWRRWLGLA
ncbi:MAG TPA: glutamine amidotransferase [Gemmataceae bacterium]